MREPKREPAPYAGLVAPYNSIPDYTATLVLPDFITVLYARLSKDDKQRSKDKTKEDDSDSILNQKLILAKFAYDNRLPNPVFFVDDGISGTTFDRPDVQAALGLVEAGRVKSFVVKDLSRFGRDRLKVDYYHEIMFPDLDVRFVAINDNIDSSKGENDMAPIRSLFNEYYARDTSKKVRAVFRAKGMAGERLSSFAPYGYMKDPSDKKKLVIDEVAAEVVRKIFRLCLAGLGVTHIANRLKDEQILTPSHHFANMGISIPQKLPTIPYDWEGATVKNILARREYLGHTVNFKTYSKSFRNKTTMHNPLESQVVFEDTHPAIIDQETFDRVQTLREGRRRRTNSGRVGLFAGIVFCEECGSRHYFTSGANQTQEQDAYVCSGFRSKKATCSHSHYIRSVTLEQMVSEYLERVKDFATQHEKAFVAHIMQGAEAKSRKALIADKSNLAKIESRIVELDRYIQRLFEDNVDGRLSHERFNKLSEGYEREQKELEASAKSLREQIEETEQKSVGVEQFVRIIRRQTNVTNLTPTILNELIEQIEVHAPDKSTGKRIQEITVHFSLIGAIGKLDILESEMVSSAEIGRR
ncbi:recombinase family protein [Candidatus Saccharibacteria bacterium]|nr:recombinase family protein [Candidatus Saccharibacteria bacterium]